MGRPVLAYVAYGHDIFMAAAAILVALYLRLGERVFDLPITFILTTTVIFAGLATATFWPMGLYRGIWRYASMNDLIQITKAVTVVCVVFVPVMFMISRAEFVPRSLPVITWFVLMTLLGAPRFAYRRFRDRRVNAVQGQASANAVPVLLVGAGDEAETFIRAMQRSVRAEYRAVAVLDEKGKRVGRRIHDVPVLGDLDALERVYADLDGKNTRPQRLIVTKAHLGGEPIRDLLDRADALGMTVARLPALTDFKTGAADEMHEMQVRPIDVEDLLRRPQTVLDRRAMRELVEDKVVMVTGAGGSIGAELSRQIAALAPQRIVLVDNSEYNLYTIDLELAEASPDIARLALLVDVRDAKRIDRTIADVAPHLVFHAAALKHVPIVEDHPCEGVLTNTIGTANVADACRRARVSSMVLISTDKAVNPSNVMGATKRAAETYCQALDIEGQGKTDQTRFIVVRFGNVLGSTGSVVPLFERQIARGGPLTVTHPDVTRYFMTIREAVELVLQASCLNRTSPGASLGNVFVLEMGEPVKIVELARQMIRLSGRRPDKEIGIEMTGLRKGEKLHERLFYEQEELQPTEAEGVMVAGPHAADAQILRRLFAELNEASRNDDVASTIGLLRQIVAEFSPQPDLATAQARATAHN
ncbi:MAG: nucleoside-diphosphate sugar epimerase/dehydratase [Alphaproteobacteria bacterium]|nr:nucleoside-diphosphate sugar epimerase/dehydratase [Alphaproteobacteria bacterium]